jgi:hypothetical protein
MKISIASAQQRICHSYSKNHDRRNNPVSATQLDACRFSVITALWTNRQEVWTP